MKTKQLILLILPFFILSVLTCGGLTERHYYYKSFFINETAFTIDGEVFVNDTLTEKVDFDNISVKVESIRNWEIEGVKKQDKKFELAIDITANGISLSENTSAFDSFSFANGFKCSMMSFFVDGRRARGAIDPEFNQLYWYVYVNKPFELIKTDFDETSGLFGDTYHYFYYYDLDFSNPGWYKIYYSEDKDIGNKEAYSSGNNTKIRAPR